MCSMLRVLDVAGIGGDHSLQGFGVLLEHPV
jgi:hypothetical protein